MTDIELIKNKLDIVDLISSYIPNVKRAGSNYKAVCPFHNEKTPSFMINPSLQIYKCFGCGKGGDVFSFIQEIERVDFQEALKIAAEKAGVELTQVNFSKDKKSEEEKQKIIEANTLTAKYYHYIFNTHNSGLKGRKYAKKRGIDAERIKKFMIGYAPEGRDNLKKFLVSKGFEEKDLIRWGLLVERGKSVIDKFRNRLMQPIFNLKGEIVGFSGRYIGTSKEAPKYLNSPETLVYKKNEILYGLFQARDAMRKEKFVIVEEGNIDILSSHRVGVENIVAPLGTAFTENQAKLLKRFVDEIYFCFDTDNAGINALIKGVAISEELGLKHRVIDIQPFKDPDDLIMNKPDEWKKKIEKSKNSIEYLIDIFSKDLDLGSVDGKTKFSAKIMPILRMIRDDIAQSHFVKQVSVMLEVTEDVLWAKIVNEKTLKRSIKKDGSIERKEAAKENFSKKMETYLLSLILTASKLDDVKLDPKLFQDENVKEIYEQLLQNKSEDPAAIYDKLSERSQKVFEDIMMFDSTGIDKIDDEISKIENSIRESFLKREILKLRRAAGQGDEIESVKKLQELTLELGKLKKNRK